METTEGTLLGGRVRYVQPVEGYRTGIEPVFLAACIPARPNERVLEAGTGAGAALLCLAHRIPGLVGIGIERDPDMADLARRNLTGNDAPFTILKADVTALPPLPPAHHVFANPPWHDPAGTQPSHARRAVATHRGSGSREGGLAAWIDALVPLATATLTLILPAALVGEAMARLHAGPLAQLTLHPLWPRTGRPAKIVLIQATPGAGPTRTAPGVVLHGAGTGYTPAAEAILRKGEALRLS